MKTNWKDDIFTRRKLRLEQNDDGTVTPVDATEYTQQGDSFGAKELNTMGEEVNALTAEVESTKKSVSDGKALVAAAITAKRVKTAATATFPEMAANIDKIILGSGNAQPADVLAGKTATNDSGVEFTGTMPERGSKSITLPINGSQDLPAGHYSGVQIRQSIPTLGGVTITPGASQQTIAASGKYGTGNHIIKAVANLTAANIKKDVTVGGVTGTCDYAESVSSAAGKIFDGTVTPMYLSSTNIENTQAYEGLFYTGYAFKDYLSVCIYIDLEYPDGFHWFFPTIVMTRHSFDATLMCKKNGVIYKFDVMIDYDGCIKAYFGSTSTSARAVRMYVRGVSTGNLG